MLFLNGLKLYPFLELVLSSCLNTHPCGRNDIEALIQVAGGSVRPTTQITITYFGIVRYWMFSGRTFIKLKRKYLSMLFP